MMSPCNAFEKALKKSEFQGNRSTSVLSCCVFVYEQVQVNIWKRAVVLSQPPTRYLDLGFLKKRKAVVLCFKLLVLSVLNPAPIPLYLLVYLRQGNYWISCCQRPMDHLLVIVSFREGGLTKSPAWILNKLFAISSDFLDGKLLFSFLSSQPKFAFSTRFMLF